jgi:hypothetical protein
MTGAAGRATAQPAFTGDSVQLLSASAEAQQADPVRDVPSGPAEFTVDAPDPSSDVSLSVADFGADPESEDNYDAFMRAIREAKAQKAGHLVVPQGVYYFRTGHDALVLSGLSDLTLDGQGAELVWRNPAVERYGGMFSLLDCQRIEIKDIVLDWDWSVDPLGSLVEVIAVESAGRHLDIRFNEHTRFPNRETIVKVLEAVDPATGAVGCEGKRDIYVDWNDVPAPPNRTLEWLSGNTARLHAFDDARRNNFRRYAAVGDLFRARHYAYGAAAVGLRRSGHITLTGVKIYACPGMAVVGRDRPHHVRLSDCAIVRRPDADRMISCTADHINFGDTLGYLIVENCDVGWGGDDCINVHNGCAPATRLDDQTFAARLSDHIYKVGDLIEFRRRDLSPLGFYSRVRSLRPVQTPAGARTAVTLADPIPESLPDEVVLYNREIHSGNVIVRNCYFHENRARGVLVEAPDYRIENCRFHRIQMAALLFNSGFTMEQWNEGQEVRNVVIRGNTFEDCNKARIGEKGPQVFITVYLGKTDTPETKTSYPVFSDILFEDNTFIDCPSSSFFVSSARNVVIQNNTFHDANSRKINPPERAMMYVSYASEIAIVNNHWMQSPYVAKPGAWVDTSNTSAIRWEGNTVLRSG